MTGFRLGPLFASAAIIVLLLAATTDKRVRPVSRAEDGGTIAAAAATVAAPKSESAAIEGDEVPAPAAAAPAAVTPKPAVVVDADAAVGEKLRELAGGKFDRVIGGKKERAAFDAFYSNRDYAPLWISDGNPNARAKAAIAYLGRVEADGLEPADYPGPDFSTLVDPAALAEAEIRLTMSVVTYARHAQLGRVHWSRVSGDIFYTQKQPAPAEILGKITEARDVGEALDAYEPRAPAYLALKAKLAELRAGKAQSAKAVIPNGPVLKVGMQDERVPRLRERLGIDGDSMTFDKVLADALKKFQQEHELKPSGFLTQQTVEALNSHQPDRLIDTIIVNMERWRWMPHDLGDDYVIVNLPDYTLRVFQHDRQIWMTKIVIGAPSMPTPITTAEMKYITVNPTWNVPTSIVTREYLPALQQDPTVLERMGLRVSTNPDGTLHISQPSGDHNALGRLRFNFPNKFLVYQHDTPDKNLFALEKRALSHGCMRVQDPAKYAEVLLSIVRPGEGYTEDRILKMFGQGEMDIQFHKTLPVHLTYQTVLVDEDGKLEFREDIYGRDKALLAILNSSGREVADIPVARKDDMARRQALAMSDQFWGGFFERSFGGSFSESRPIPPRPLGRSRSQYQ
ncbi:MAG: L,D-transpeptidase family protein [Xanthobacteraceae bacterium]|jgi:L,D-transpeptidase YcbB